MAELLLANPRKRSKKRRVKSHRRVRRARTHKAPRRRRHHATKAVRKYRRNPAVRSHRRRRYRRNPSLRGLTSGVVPTLKSGAVGAVGALATDLAWGYGSKYLPTSMQTGIAATAARLLTAIVVGFAAGKVVPKYGKELAVGAVTVQLHDLAKAQLMVSIPSLPLGKYVGLGAYFGVGTNAMGYRNNLATPVLQTGLGRLGGLGNTRVMSAENTPGDYNDGIF